MGFMSITLDLTMANGMYYMHQSLWQTASEKLWDATALAQNRSNTQFLWKRSNNNSTTGVPID